MHIQEIFFCNLRLNYDGFNATSGGNICDCLEIDAMYEIWCQKQVFRVWKVITSHNILWDVNTYL